MTAEVAVFNKSAVALAADSAVTISRNDRNEKTYIVNKLFTLSKYRPVGVMVYDSAELCGIPWETIIKAYRKHLGKGAFGTLQEYVDDLLSFLTNSPTLFPKERQQAVFDEVLILEMMRIQSKAKEAIEEITSGGKKVTKAQVKDITETKIAERHTSILRHPRIKSVADDAFAETVAKKLSKAIASKIKVFFPKQPLSRTSLKKLREIGVEACLRHHPFGKTGVVVAGFGEDEIYPRVITFIAQGVINNTLIYEMDGKNSFIPDEKCVGVLGDYAGVLPFAQTDVVTTFVNGISPQFQSMVIRQIKSLLEKYPDVVADKVGITDPDEIAKLKHSLTKHGEEAVKHIISEFSATIAESQVEPLLEVVAALPKDELANLANALVELTSAKRKVSRGLATVGGPVDVALISKGDGFIWISRKHYFKRDLNLAFSANYFEDGQHDKGE